MDAPSFTSRLKLCWACVCFLLVAACFPANPVPPLVDNPAETADRSVPFDHSHRQYDRVLKKHVHDGWVDYQGIIAEPTVFYDYMNSMANMDSRALTKWSREQQLAFWINAYNACTIKAIIERYPITSRSLVGIFFPQNSILQISGVWTRLKFNIAGQLVTLEHIEHDILRANFKEPRIHFAIVCASRSCPVLRSEAYRADILESQLESQAIGFINDPDRGLRWDPVERCLVVSKIFKWFSEDFDRTGIETDATSASQLADNPLLGFIRPYVRDERVTSALTDGRDIEISYLPYDWRLNDWADKKHEQLKRPDNDG